MSHVVKYEACPKCRSNGNDNRGDNLVRYADGGAHCFACGYHEHVKHYQPIYENLPTNVKKIIPDDWTRDVPVQALKWLLQYGLPWSYWKDSIGFSPKDARLVFLVGSPVAFSIGRYIPELALPAGYSNSSTPGYKIPNVKLQRKWYVWGDSHRHCEAIGRGERVVLVEDLISAHKLVVATQDTATPVTAIPLFGVEVHPCHLYYIRQEQKPVVLWLDKDQQGSVMKKANQLAVLTGVPVRTITTERDPKCLSSTEIQNQLQ